MSHRKLPLTATATATEIATVVSEALQKAGVDAVLSGGGAVAIHSGGAVLSKDLDFVTAAGRTDIDPIMETPHGSLRVLTATAACQDRLIQWKVVSSDIK